MNISTFQIYVVNNSTRNRGKQSSRTGIAGKRASTRVISMSVAGGAAQQVISSREMRDAHHRSMSSKGSNNGKFVKGDVKRCAEVFGRSVDQVSGVWHPYKPQKDAGVSAVNITSSTL